MLIKKCFFAFLAVVVLWACSDGEDTTTESAVVLDKTTQTTQTVYADETQKNEGIKFTATEPWTATVDEVKTKAEGSNVDWLKLSAYSGGAGEFTLNLTLTPNTTGKSRKAEIRIVAGKTVLTITVEQKAETESGEEVVKAKAVKKIAYKLVDDALKAEYPEYSDNYTSEKLFTFSYDDKGRVKELVRKEIDRCTQISTMTFDYATAGRIKMSEKWVEDGNHLYDEDYIAILNEQGNVINLQADDKEAGRFEDYIRFSYTDDNRLAQWKDADAGSETSYVKYSYANGLLSKYEYVNGKASDDDRTLNIDMDKAYANRYPNNASVDVMWILEDDDDYDFLYLIGRLGKTSDYAPEVLPANSLRYDEWSSVSPVYTTPNVTVDASYISIEWSDKDLVMSYTYDADKCLTGIKTERAFTMKKTTYKVHVGNELNNPNNPEEGYKYTTSDKRTVDAGSDKNVYTWTMEY